MGGWYSDPFGKKFTFDRISHGNSHLIDFNNDNRLDAWSMGWGQNISCGNDCGASLYTNTSDAVNNAPEKPSNLNVAYNATDGTFTFSWDAPADDSTPAEALRYNIYVKKAGSDNIFMTIPGDIATGRMKVTELAAAIAPTRYSMALPAENDLYEWGVQAIDNGKASGLFATSTFNPAELSSAEAISIDRTPRLFPLDHAVGYDTCNVAGTLSIYNATGILIRNDNVKGNGNIPLPLSGLYIATLISLSVTPATLKLLIN